MDEMYKVTMCWNWKLHGSVGWYPWCDRFEKTLEAHNGNGITCVVVQKKIGDDEIVQCCKDIPSAIEWIKKEVANG